MPSSVIYTIQYDPDSAILRITYVSGSIYDYKQVPENIYWELKASGSKGVYLNLYIKGFYEYEKIC
ncbi:MAG TPA: KTSC domain-containing protein [Saprospiraceae bacterium]|nr:KTSC domain-containing protein [Saprospiraceae bacterium]